MSSLCILTLWPLRASRPLQPRKLDHSHLENCTSFQRISLSPTLSAPQAGQKESSKMQIAPLEPFQGSPHHIWYEIQRLALTFSMIHTNPSLIWLLAIFLALSLATLPNTPHFVSLNCPSSLLFIWEAPDAQVELGRCNLSLSYILSILLFHISYHIITPSFKLCLPYCIAPCKLQAASQPAFTNPGSREPG